jgi:hypothetical protein
VRYSATRMLDLPSSINSIRSCDFAEQRIKPRGDSSCGCCSCFASQRR